MGDAAGGSGTVFLTETDCFITDWLCLGRLPVLCFGKFLSERESLLVDCCSRSHSCGLNADTLACIQKRFQIILKAFRAVVIPARFERATHSLEGCCSIQLSYGTGRNAVSARCAVAWAKIRKISVRTQYHPPKGAFFSDLFCRTEYFAYICRLKILNG